AVGREHRAVKRAGMTLTEWSQLSRRSVFDCDENTQVGTSTPGDSRPQVFFMILEMFFLEHIFCAEHFRPDQREGRSHEVDRAQHGIVQWLARGRFRLVDLRVATTWGATGFVLRRVYGDRRDLWWVDHKSHVKCRCEDKPRYFFSASCSRPRGNVC